MNSSNKELYNYVVFKFNVYDAGFLIMPVSELPNSGFSSLYCITAETAQTLEAAGIAGYKGPVWSPSLALDFDDTVAAERADRELRRMGLAFEKWSTGNRGFHFYIERPHAPSHVLPQIDKMWSKSNFPQADLSIYSHLHMFRVPGTKHVKTGRPKVLIESVPGQPLFLPDFFTQESDPTHRALEQVEGERSLFDDKYVMNLTVPWEDGKRHEALLNLGLAMKRKGEDISFISRWLYHTNLLFSVPKTHDELERIVKFVEEAVVND